MLRRLTGLDWHTKLPLYLHCIHGGASSKLLNPEEYQISSVINITTISYCHKENSERDLPRVSDGEPVYTVSWRRFSGERLTVRDAKTTTMRG